MNKIIPPDQYSEIIRVLPILCVDIIIKNINGEYLLVKRNNEPKKDEWWIIGGRVLKGETLQSACLRKAKEEAGLRISNVSPIGYYELFADKNAFGLPFAYHTVSVVFEATIDDLQRVRLDKQSKEFKFSKSLPSDLDIKSFN